MWERWITCTPAERAYWDTQSQLADTATFEEDSGTLRAFVCTLEWSRTTPVGFRDDVATINFGIARSAGTGLYAAPQVSDCATLEGHIDTWWTAQKALHSSEWTLTAIRWHEFRTGREKDGPALRSVGRAVAGAVSASRGPDQIASTVSFKTSARKHWGRVYLPGIRANQVDSTTGRFVNTFCDTTAASWRTLQVNIAAAGYAHVVISRSHQALLSIQELMVDNTPDVIRRRRAKQTSYRKSYTS